MEDEMDIFDDSLFNFEDSPESIYKAFLENDDEDEGDEDGNEDESKSKNDLKNNKNNKSVDDESREEVDDEEDDEGEGDEDKDSPNIFSSLSEVFIEQGLLPSLESSKDIKSVEDFVNAFQKEIENQADLRLSKFIEGLDVEKISYSKKEKIELDSIDEDYLKSNLEKAKEIIKIDLINQGLSEEKANRLLKKTIDLGEDLLIEEAMESKLSIQKYNEKKELEAVEQRKQEIAKEREEAQKTEKYIKNLIFESKEIIPGIPNNKSFAETLFKSMNEVVAKNPETGELENKLTHERSKDPIGFDVRLYAIFELTKGFKDLSAIGNFEKTKATKKFEKLLRQNKFEDSNLPSYMIDNNSYDGGIGSQLVL